MPRRAKGLTAAKVGSAKPGRYGDGAGLYLLVKPSRAQTTAGREPELMRFWLFRYVRGGKMREMGLGPASGPAPVSLAKAREKRDQLREQVRQGLDPLAERDAERARRQAEAALAAANRITFREVAERYIAAHEAAWRNPKHRAQWGSTLATYVYPVIGDRPVAAVETGAVTEVLEPIWREKPETASRVRGRIESVLDYAKALGWREGENPARWRGHLDHVLPARGKVRQVEHHAALPWRKIGPFMQILRQAEGMGAKALQFAILTAARSNEIRGARWDEVDFAQKLWTVPADRMKARREHRVPLSDAALDLLRELLPLRSADDALIFPGARPGKPLSDMSLTAVLRRMERGDLTAHGFRSTFRDWAAEATAYPRELAEKALAHTLSDKVEAAYQRGDMFDKRRRLMADWAAYCAGAWTIDDGVVPLRGEAAA